MKWMTNLIETYKKGTQFDSLKTEFEEYKKESNQMSKIIIEDFENQLTLCKQAKFNYAKEIEELKEELNKLLTQNKLNILELKDWYENRRNQNTWLYNGNRLGRTDVKNYLIPSDIKPFTKLAKEIIERYSITEKHSPTEIITFMYRYWNLTSSWRYVTDMALYGVIEMWEDPTEAVKRRTGDCETKAKCMLNTATEMLRILKKSNHEWRLTFIASVVAGEGGHAYLTWLYDDGEYYVIESTYYEHSSKQKTWLKTPMRFNNMYQNPWGFATKTRSWTGTNSALMNFREV